MINQAIAFLISLVIFLTYSLSMNSDTAMKALVKKQATAWETQDTASLIEDFAPNAVFKAARFTFNGVDAIEKAAEDYFRDFSDTKVEIKRIIIKGNEGAVEWDFRDRNRKTGKPSAAEDAIIFEVGDDGKIIYWREYIEKKKVQP